MLEIVGTSLTGVTVKRNDWVALSEPSLTVNVTCTLPDAFVAGVSVAVRLAPLPVMTISEFGNIDWSEELAVTIKLVTALSTSAIVKGTESGISSRVV